MNEKMPIEVDGVSFPKYIVKKDSLILVPKPTSKAEILRTEPDLEKDRSFQAEKIAVATRLVERCEVGEIFPFPGLHQEAYDSMKRDWEEEPDYAVNVDALIQRFQDEGIKVVFTKDPTSGNVLIIPSGSTDIESDSILPRLLSINDIADPTLFELCMMESLHNSQKIKKL